MNWANVDFSGWQFEKCHPILKILFYGKKNEKSRIKRRFRPKNERILEVPWKDPDRGWGPASNMISAAENMENARRHSDFKHTKERNETAHMDFLDSLDSLDSSELSDSLISPDSPTGSLESVSFLQFSHKQH